MSDIQVVWDGSSETRARSSTPVNGLPFTYVVPGNFLRVEREGAEINRSLSRMNFEGALDLMPAAGPGALNGRQGPSYTWAILMDPRIRLSDW